MKIFHDKMEQAKETASATGEVQDELSVMPEDRTDIEDIRIYADYDSQKLTIGPYSSRLYMWCL